MDVAPVQRLEVATPERVGLDLPIAGIGHRALAYLVDVLALLLFWVVAYFVLSLITSDMLGFAQGLSPLVTTLVIVGLFASQWLYWTLSEVLGSGQTLGKRLLRIRVVRDDGAPVTVFDSAVRNLFRLIDFLPAGYALGLVVMLLHRENRRIGDVVAGTVLVRQEAVDLDRYTASPPLAESHPRADPLPADDVELILTFLERAPGLGVKSREKLTRTLLDRFGASASAAERSALAEDWPRAEAFLRARAHQEPL